MNNQDNGIILDLSFVPGCCVTSLIGCVLLTLLIAFGIRTVSAADTDHWICESAAIYSFVPGARQAEWSEADQTWRVRDIGDPSTLADDTWQYWTGDESGIEMGIMYADASQNENSPAYVEFIDRKARLIWRFAFIDTISTSEGGRWGMHHSCEQGPVVFDMGDR